MTQPQLKLYFETSEEVQMVKDTAALLGMPVSRMIREMVLNSLPHLQKVGEAIQEIKKDPIRSSQLINRLVRDSQRTLFDEMDEIDQINPQSRAIG